MHRKNSKDSAFADRDFDHTRLNLQTNGTVATTSVQPTHRQWHIAVLGAQALSQPTCPSQAKPSPGWWVVCWGGATRARRAGPHTLAAPGPLWGCTTWCHQIHLSAICCLYDQVVWDEPRAQPVAQPPRAQREPNHSR